MADHAIEGVVTIHVDRFRQWVPQLVDAVARIGGIDTATLIAPGCAGLPVTLRAAIVLAAHDVLGKGWSDIGRALHRTHGGASRTYVRAQHRLAGDREFQQLMRRVFRIAHAIAGTDPERPL